MCEYQCYDETTDGAFGDMWRAAKAWRRKPAQHAVSPDPAAAQQASQAERAKHSDQLDYLLEGGNRTRQEWAESHHKPGHGSLKYIADSEKQGGDALRAIAESDAQPRSIYDSDTFATDDDETDDGENAQEVDERTWVDELKALELYLAIQRHTELWHHPEQLAHAIAEEHGVRLSPS